MAKTLEEKTAFIDLRAKGLSYKAISERLGVSKSVLLNWAKDFERDIREQRAWELQALLERYKVAKMARLEGFAKTLEGVQEELARRIDSGGFSEIPADKLMAMALELDKRLSQEVAGNILEVGGVDDIIRDDLFKVAVLELD
jgi:transcriptional regulator with XRE-family HTH domain